MFEESGMTNKYFQISVVLIAVFMLSGCVTGALIDLQTGNKQAIHKFQSRASKVSLPFYWHDDHIMLELAINDKEHLKFALDSGAAVTVLFETPRTKGVELDISQTLDLNGHTVDLVAGASVKLADISIDDLVIIHVPLSQSPLFNSQEEAYFDGAIGFDVFNQYAIEIDFDQQLVHFYNPKQELENSGWQPQALEFYGNVPHVKGELMNNTGQLQSLNWVIDTGAPDHLYFNSKHEQKIDGPSVYFTTKFANFEGEQLKNTGRMEAFELFGSRFDQVSSHDLTEFEDPYAFGLIGAGLLRNFNLRFDYKDQTLWTKKNTAFSSFTRIDRSGLELEPHTQGAVVKSVTKGIELPIIVGDVLTKINNKQISADNFDAMRNILSSNLNSIDVCWLSQQNLSCGVLPLADRVQ